MVSQVKKYQQVIEGLGKIVVLVTNSKTPYPNEVMRLAVSDVVGRELHNEMIDISLHRPFMRLIFMGDINRVHWQPYKQEKDCEYAEFDLYNQEKKWIGKVVFLRGGLYSKKPNEFMSKIVVDYLNGLDEKGTKYTSYNEMVEIFLDNPWFRVVLLNIDKIAFEEFREYA